MGAVLVLPATVAGQQGPVASLLSTAGWLTACHRVLGDAWLVTPEGVIDATEARRLASAAELAPPSASNALTRRAPTVVKTAVKDVRQWARGRAFRIDRAGPWEGRSVDFVWQRHELFHTAGIDLSHRLGAPSVVFVPATSVWEASRWGVRRPGWGAVAERFGEAPTLRSASLVACGSDEVAEQVERMGADPARILVTPTGVDLDAVAGPADRQSIRTGLGLGPSDFVIGWVGSFRPFHAVHRLVEAVAGEPRIVLLLVGDGPERRAVEARASELGVRAVFTGTVAHTSLHRHLAVMDAAVVVPPDDGAFHYSPLKLAEYLAAGLAVVAPDVPTVSSRVVDGLHALLVEPNDPDALRESLMRLRDDDELRARLGQAARAEARATWSWDHQVRHILDALARLTACRERTTAGGGPGSRGSIVRRRD